MIKKLLVIIFCGFCFLGATGCGKKNSSVTVDELNDVNNKIIEYFSNDNVEYNNLSFNYVDEENKVVIVGLIDNSKKQQEQFKKNVVDSNLIKFIQGSENINLPKKSVNVEKNIQDIVNGGSPISSSPFDYIKASQEEYDELLEYPKETFEYSIKDLIDNNADNGLKSYIEAILCSEINENFKYDFNSASDYLEHYKEFLTKSDSIFNDYDRYALSLLNTK